MGRPAGDEGDRSRQRRRDRSREGAARTRVRGDRAVLMGLVDGAVPEGGRVLMELGELARTAGADVLAEVIQNRDAPDGRTFLGRGRAAELATTVRELGANVILCDKDLSPAQVRNLEALCDVRVIDRSELILDIFATHARSLQARLQVELAQLQYLAPRLKRMWTHLSRITGSGGIGSRGPGEKQIEVDRRVIGRRMTDLRERLRDIAARQERVIASRAGVPMISLVGYTNAGKSTLMNALTGADAYVADQLFATLDTRTRRWDVGGVVPALLSDTVGFIRDLPHHLVASFHATLAEVKAADLLLHVVDASNPEAPLHVATVRDVLRSIGAGSVPELLVLNKIDGVTDPVERQILERRFPEGVAASALGRATCSDVEAAVRARLEEDRVTMDLVVPLSDGRTLAALERDADVLSRAYTGGAARLQVRLPRHLGPLYAALAAGASPPAGEGGSS